MATTVFDTRTAARRRKAVRIARLGGTTVLPEFRVQESLLS